MGLNWVNKNKSSNLGRFIEKTENKSESNENGFNEIKIKENTGIVEKATKKAKIITEDNKELLKD